MQEPRATSVPPAVPVSPAPSADAGAPPVGSHVRTFAGRMMQQEPTGFSSDGLRLTGSFFVPDDLDPHRPSPLVIPCSGFTGLLSIHPARFARYLTANGLMCFGFDYRGFGASEGVRGRVILEEQVRDILHATAFAASDPRVDPQRIFLLGWGMGAGLCLDAAREQDGVIGLIAVNGFYSGKRVQLMHRGPAGYRAFHADVEQERKRRAKTGARTDVNPFNVYPLDKVSESYVDQVLRRYDGYDAASYSFELADSLIRWYPEAYAPSMDTPILIAHGENNRLQDPEEARSLFDKYGGPKELYWIPGVGHTEWMHDHDARFLALGARIVEWIDHRLVETGWRAEPGRRIAQQLATIAAAAQEAPGRDGDDSPED